MIKILDNRGINSENDVKILAQYHNNVAHLYQNNLECGQQVERVSNPCPREI